MPVTDTPIRPSRALLTVLATGLLIGVLDITFAWVFWSVKAGVELHQVFQSVAAGLLGRAAREGGAATVALGAVIHFFIATGIAAVYYFAARRLPALWRNATLCGIAYGVAVYLVMNRVVVPLSAAPSPSRNPLWIGLSIAVHMLLIGLPSALAARRLLAPASPAAL